MTSDKSRNGNELFTGYVPGEYFNSSQMINQRVLIKSDTKVFMYPDAEYVSDTNYYGIKNSSYFRNDTAYNIVYFKDTNKGFDAPVFMQKYTDAGLATYIDSPTSIITKITNAVDEDGNAKLKLYLYTRGTESSILTDSELRSGDTHKIPASELMPGDIIYYTVSSITGETDGFAVYYHNGEALQTAGGNMTESWVLLPTKEGIKVVPDSYVEKNGIEAAPDCEAYVIYNNMKYPVVIYDTQRHTGRMGSYRDLSGYEEDPSDYDKVIIRYYSSLMREMYLYK